MKNTYTQSHLAPETSSQESACCSSACFTATRSVLA